MNKERKPIVWVLKEQVMSTPNGPVPMDYTAAMRFGEIQFITEYDPPAHPGSSLREQFDRSLEKFVGTFDPQNDFIVPTGSPLAIVSLGRVLGRRFTAPFRVLVWRREQQRYVEAVV